MTTQDASEAEPEHPHSSPSDSNSLFRFQDLTAQATAKYALKDYNAAAELYSMATEIQAKLNGEMSTKNADLLYAYGKCLYHVAVSSSDVLGTKIAGEGQGESKKSKSKATNGESSKTGAVNGKRVAEEAVGVIANGKESVESGTKAVESKPYFHFTGDENWDSSDGEDEGADGEAEEPEDDFANAFEVLDMARLLLQRKLKDLQSEEGKGKASGDPETVRQVKERLADTYDLQAEISLEGERFPNAVVDLRSALELKRELFPQGSSLVAEAHFKLSLALEFSSVTQQQDETGAPINPHAQVDEAMREEAAREMEAAITSCKIRIEQEEKTLASGESTNGSATGKKPTVTRESIDDVKEMVKDMEDRLIELRKPPVSINDPTGTGTIDGTNPLAGILGQLLGESPEAKKARVEQATEGANDLTGLVRRKKEKMAPDGVGPSANASTASTNGKRKLEMVEEGEGESEGKKVRVDKT